MLVGILIEFALKVEIMEIVLIEPEIPQNTGNIARSCALTGTKLHLVGPLGYSLDDRYLKRAGLDYWPEVNLQVWESFQEWEQAFTGRRLLLATTKTTRSYSEVAYRGDEVLVFGCETRGLPNELLSKYPEGLIRIPMRDLGRSLNLANSVAVILFEALRQQGFPGLV
ncbi:MAG: tRNA (cytidine(34)-2'-O)-methyltransferase [Methylocystaceae bacterium]